MKSLYLIRHAKSDWDANYGHDHDRPLSPRGIKAAKRMGRLLEGSGMVPQALLSSTAVRARTTVELASEEGGWGCEIQLFEDLYGGTVQTILAHARRLPDDIESAMFAGHEPGWSAAVSALIGGGDVRFPTACLARIDFRTDRWRDLRSGDGQLIFLIPPKALG